MPANPGPPAPAAPAPGPVVVIRSRGYLRLLVLAGLIGVPVSAVAYGLLALVDRLQNYLYDRLPVLLGFGDAPLWWPLPLPVAAGFLVALCIRHLPGTGGHPPSEGFKAGGVPNPVDLPGVALAALATLALGAILDPEAPLIALGAGLGALAIRLIRKDSPPTAVAVIASAGSFAAVSTLLGSPLLGAFLLMEASGLGGAMLGVGLLPGLLAAGIGSLVFVGLDSWTGLGTFSLAIPDLPAFSTSTLTMFGWALLLGAACPLLAWGIRAGALLVRPAVHAQRLGVMPALGAAIAALAIGDGVVTGQDATDVLFSGQSALPALISDGAAWPVGAVALLVACKALAYALSLGAFRGWPVFPAIFLGAAMGVAASHLPGMALVPAVGVGIGAMCVSMLRLPLTSVLLATVLLSSDAVAVTPLVIVAVVVAHVVTGRLPEPPGRRLSWRLTRPAPGTAVT
ncbi:chloride channel protein [Cryobacterium sp.]|uniref:chloride channel protein n=1 Tax=Cryobacterium sp. TaxID=1926290 RepID=UPI00261FC15D|nr:chloride channel protein [Cryobacterium sp.]MCU1447272.1 Cl-channel voltage-gated family protein [Cryobacterium sp.]